MYLEITNDIHLGLKFGCCNAENRKSLSCYLKYRALSRTWRMRARGREWERA